MAVQSTRAVDMRDRLYTVSRLRSIGSFRSILMAKPDRIDRRHFATHLVLGASGLAAALAPATLPAMAEDKPAEKQPDEPTPKTELPPPEVLLLTYVARRHPSEHFDEASLQGIFRDIRGDIARGRQLSDFPLKNWDEPSFAFGAYRAAD
jgi:hypothetical protein